MSEKINSNIQLYMAPLEGVTGYICRNAQHDMFGGIDKYYAPFIDARINRPLKSKEIRDILPENNPNIPLVPQIMGNNPEAFMLTVRQFQELGYSEFNLNLGCPSPTVVKKGRGAGFLGNPDALYDFFQWIYEDAAFASGELKLSVKARLGMERPEEMERLLIIYNRFPITELILHPRLQTDYYKNTTNLDAFEQVHRNSEVPLIYNGDVNTIDDGKKILERFPEIGGLMLGRGMLANPALAREITGGAGLSMKELKAFHNRIYEEYQDYLSGEVSVLHKMKELWNYWIGHFEGGDKPLKKIKKSQHLRDYEQIVEQLFHEVV